MDLIHYYALTLIPDPDEQRKLTRAVTGPTETQPATAGPRPPAWSSLTSADLQRMTRHRAAAQAKTAGSPS